MAFRPLALLHAKLFGPLTLPRLGAFLDTYPEIVVDLVIDDRFANIVEHGFDAGVRLGESLDKEMVAVRISADERVAVVAAPSYFINFRRPPRRRRLSVGVHRRRKGLRGRRSRARGRLVRVLGDFCPPCPGHFLYYPSRAHIAPKLRALIDFLRVDEKRA